MTNYDELVKRLREHARNCRILDMSEGRPSLVDEAASAIEALQRQLVEKDESLREAVEALGPFAEAYEAENMVGREDPDDDRILIVQAHGCQLVETDIDALRRAAAIVAKQEKSE